MVINICHHHYEWLKHKHKDMAEGSNMAEGFDMAEASHTKQGYSDRVSIISYQNSPI